MQTNTFFFLSQGGSILINYQVQLMSLWYYNKGNKKHPVFYCVGLGVCEV